MLCGNNAFWYGRHFHSIKPLYTHWWIGQAIFYGLAGWMADALPIVVVCCMGATPAAEWMAVVWCGSVRVLYGSNESVSRALRSAGLVEKSAELAVLEKKRWWSDA